MRDEFHLIELETLGSEDRLVLCTSFTTFNKFAEEFEAKNISSTSNLTSMCTS